jgi:hypothetical protein
VSDISLSPAWSVMIIFLFVDRSSGRVLGPPSQCGDLGAVAGAFGQAALPVRSTGRGLATVKRPKSRSDSGRS